ncbi:hypothetical protein J1N35_040628 [Gossypium stocksii]|uniref:Uncharacterized protein n=1 Tax=Gossypium stocksii TaxID=47602 RepID=A0A9D3UE99_9ROSI|nr:hypothetical protein J1N35_040628 [Gossypium stocksii]
MSSFSQMLKFKQKTVPHPQLLKWVEWFSKFSFDTKHINGKDNILADFLSRPKTEIFAFKRTSSNWPKPIMMYRPSSSSLTLPTSYPITSNLNPKFPPEVMNFVHQKTFHQKAKEMMFEYQIQVFKNFGRLILKPWDVIAPWDTWPVQHKLYHEEILKAIQEYYESIPDPTEWSQDYPSYCSQINFDRIRIQDSQSQYEDKDEDFNPDAYHDALAGNLSEKAGLYH